MLDQETEDQATTGDHFDWIQIRNPSQKAEDQDLQPEERTVIWFVIRSLNHKNTRPGETARIYLIQVNCTLNQKTNDQATIGEEFGRIQINNMKQETVDQERQPEERIVIGLHAGIWINKH